MLNIRSLAAAAILGSAALTVACGSDPVAQGTGTLQLKLTDAPFPFSEVQSVDIHVLRIDGKAAQTTDADADDDTVTVAAIGGPLVRIPFERVERSNLIGELGFGGES